ncbi:MAG: EamA family transporter [Rhodobacteraceae bacterium]|nr:EamA family transporter [Paracoccaceae bacterium]
MTARGRATLTGFAAVLLWALLALLTVGSAPTSPLLLNALTFAVGGAVGLVWVAWGGGLGRLRAVPARVFAFGTAALFLYHMVYFSALRLAPPAQASLVAYLWPLFIVLFSSLLPGERLRAGHVAGALIAFAGAALVVAPDGSELDAGAARGLALAFACALIWSGYSVISRRLGEVPTEAVAVFCCATAALSALAAWAAHATGIEPAVWPDRPAAWLAVLGLGLGPVGLAFYVWDIGVKRGDIQLLGTAAYAAPVLSTTALVAAGLAKATPVLALAAALIAGGAAIAARAGRAPSSAATDGGSLP